MSVSPGAEGDIGRWLALLRDGSEEEQQLARTELGLILEARGLLDDAAEAYERNVAAGVSDRRPYERLAALARMRDDRETEARMLRALADLLAPLPPPPPPAPVSPPEPPVAVEPVPPIAVEVEHPPASEDGVEVAPVAEEAPEESPTTRLPIPDAAADTPDAPSDAADPAGANVVSTIVDTEPAPESTAPPEPELIASPEPAQAASERSKQAEPSVGRRGRARAEDTDPGVALHHVLEMHPEEARHHSEHRPAPPAGSSMSRTLITLALLVPVMVVVGAAALVWPGASDSGSTLPPPATPVMTVSTSPVATVEMRLIAGTPSPLPSPVATQTPTPSPTSVPTPLAARCTDVGLRFPETRDPEGAVRTAYREYLTRQGVLDAPSIEMSRLGEAYVARHEEVVAGWMAVTLQREQRGLVAFPLADYVASDVMVATGPGAYQLRATISPQGWTEIRAWPAETCEGAFMRSPANARWVDLMQASVGDITWALPTRQPTR